MHTFLGGLQVAKAAEAIQKIIDRQVELNEKRKKFEEDKANMQAAAHVVHVPDVCIDVEYVCGAACFLSLG